jgi:hypothetical protein
VNELLAIENEKLAAEFAKFLELSKQLAKQAVENGNPVELMPIVREYGPAVIRTKQLWRAVVGNPAKYDSWLGREEYRQAWVRFHESWQTLYGITEKFAAIDLDLADKLSDAIGELSQSFDNYSELVDEWDGVPGNHVYLFARGNDRLSVIARQQFRDEAAADRETKQIAADQFLQEEDADRQTKEAEREQRVEEADDDGENLFDTAPPEEKTPDKVPEPAEDDLFGES